MTKFAAQAREVDAWDRKTLEQRDRALALHETTERLKQGNTAINAELEAMLLHQEEVHAALSELEKKVAAEVASPRAPSERQQVYTLVEGLDRDLADTRADVDALVERLNAARDADGMVGAAQHLGKLVRAMDVQVNALSGWRPAAKSTPSSRGSTPSSPPPSRGGTSARLSVNLYQNPELNVHVRRARPPRPRG